MTTSRAKLSSHYVAYPCRHSSQIYRATQAGRNPSRSITPKGAQMLEHCGFVLVYAGNSRRWSHYRGVAGQLLCNSLFRIRQGLILIYFIHQQDSMSLPLSMYVQYIYTFCLFSLFPL